MFLNLCSTKSKMSDAAWTIVLICISDMLEFSHYQNNIKSLHVYRRSQPISYGHPGRHKRHRHRHPDPQQLHGLLNSDFSAMF